MRGKLIDWLIVLHNKQPKGNGMKPILRETRSECSLVAYKGLIAKFYKVYMSKQTFFVWLTVISLERINLYFLYTSGLMSLNLVMKACLTQSTNISDTITHKTIGIISSMCATKGTNINTHKLILSLQPMLGWTISCAIVNFKFPALVSKKYSTGKLKLQAVKKLVWVAPLAMIAISSIGAH